MTDIGTLHREGRLIENYPLVARALTGLAGRPLERAGNLLAALDTEELLARHPGLPTVAVAITGHGTLAALVPALTAELARHGLVLRATVDAFDGYVASLLDPGSTLLRSQPDLVACVLDHRVILDEVPVPWRPADVAKAAEEKLSLLRQIADRAAGRPLVLNTVPLPRAVSAQLLDHRSRAELGAIWREFNGGLLRLTADHPSLVVVDLDPLLAEGIRASEPRMSAYAKAHLSAELLAAYARDLGHLARNLTGRTKKALVVDLDETLWGGVLGEVGPAGVEVGDGYRGVAFAQFQQVVKQIGSQGVLLAAVSKNDAGPVSAAFREHPGMALREDDFVRIIANWRPKHDNLRELAASLNLGVDSFVFADDSTYECGLVAEELPAVRVLQLSQEPAQHAVTLLADGWFDVRELTIEDRGRGAQYRAEAARSDFLQSFDSLQDYLERLDVRVTLAEAAESDLTRVSQLTLRTNQFNLTTRRLQLENVRALHQQPETKVLTIRSADRFGDNGLVGVVFLAWEGPRLRIDNFLLSCRVFSRGIEQACLSAVLAYARDSGAAEVTGEYQPTAKNGVVGEFYPRNGFAAEPPVFRHDLTAIGPPPAHLTLTTTLGEDPR